MRDQAEELRNLVLRATAESSVYQGPAPQFITLTGAKSGVGVTTVALGVSVALAQQGTRVVLVDGDAHRPDIATRCGIPNAGSLAEIYAGRRSIHEVLQRGPAGLQLVPGGVLVDANRQNEKSQERVLHQLRSLGKHVDTVVIDVGSRCEPIIRTFWQAAQQVIVVTTAETSAIMDCYAAIKAHSQSSGGPPVGVLVNQVGQPGSGAEVHHRIDQSCQRFLQRSISFLGSLPHDEVWSRNHCSPSRRGAHAAASAAQLAVDRIAAVLADLETDASAQPSAA